MSERHPQGPFSAPLAWNQRDFETAERHFQQALELREKHGEHHRLAYSMFDLGHVAREQGQLTRVRIL